MSGKTIGESILQQVLTESTEIRKDISDIKVILERNTVSLEDHIRRTEIAESRIEKLEEHTTNCPAREQAMADKEIWKRVKNYSILFGLLVLLITEFWPAIKNILNR